MRTGAAIVLATVVLLSGLTLLSGSPVGRAAPAAPTGALGTFVPARTSVSTIVPVVAPWTPPPATSGASPPTFVWTTAQVFYGTSDPTTLLFGEGSAMGVDDAIQNTTTFGGLATGGLSNITIVYNNGTVGYWSYAASPNSTAAPSARSNMSYDVDASTGIGLLFGGLVRVGGRIVANDTWTYNYSTQTWANVTAATAPPARESAAFAIDPTDGIGLLEGGIDPNFRSGAGSGTILWNDTWTVNLSTDHWTPLALTAAPPPAYGSRMVWDPVLAKYLLFGGCDESRCTNSVWEFTPRTSAWHLLSPTNPPTARGSPSFVWDPVDNVSLLFGGFVPGPTGPVAVGDTYYLSSDGSAWVPISASDAPSPTFDAGSAFSDYSGCVGMWVQGGNGATQSVVYNVSMLQPLAEARPSCYAPIGGGTGGGPTFCSNTSAHITVEVRDAFSLAGLGGAAVTVSGSCGTSAGTTDPSGFVNITEPAPDILNVTATCVGYHPGKLLAFNYTGRAGNTAVVNLEPLPALHAHVNGRTLNGTAPLRNASVSIDHGLVLGETDVNGWLNVSAVATNAESVEVDAAATGFSTGAVNVSLPYTGVAYANFTLLAYGNVDIEARDANTGLGIPVASITVAFVDPIGANTTVEVAGPNGWWNESLLAGNYTAIASAPGFFPMEHAVAFFHPWINATVVLLNLTESAGATVDVHLLDSVTQASIPNGTVLFGSRPPVAGTPEGWANATDLGPPGYLRIDAGAPNYYPNTTTVTISAYAVLPDVVLHLTLAPPCSTYRPCQPALPEAAAAFAFLPPSGPLRILLLESPIFLGVAALAVIVVRSRLVDRPKAPPPSAGAPPRGI